ncbi:MAG: tRNA (N(6)-L-threonylcarbamoyladenosine(37)-C(2))-methylthiotransferase MtaB [Caulobacteraceae bacterium]
MNAVEIITLGCRLNAHESEALAARARADRLGPAVIINTCAVTGEAVRQARQTIRKAARRRPDARLIVTGCAAQIDPAAFAAMDGVDLVVGNVEKTRPGALLASGVNVGDIMRVGRVAPGPPASARPRACVEIQTGCDHRCTFCVIPFGRGNARSKAATAVIAEVRALALAGCKEVVLTGVDLTSWGRADADLNDPRFAGATLGNLVLAVLDEIPELPRLRLSSIDAAEVDDDLFAAFAEPRLMPHLHLSLQAGDDLILKRMKRRHSRAQALATIAQVRTIRPETAFGADFIVGFPTENEAAFERTLGLVEEARLSFLHVFPFSPRPGTPAARMPPTPSQTIKTRAARLRAAGDAARARHLADRRGASVRVLIERPAPDDPATVLGKAEDFTDVVCRGKGARALTPGTIVAGPFEGDEGGAAILRSWRIVQ